MWPYLFRNIQKNLCQHSAVSIKKHRHTLQTFFFSSVCFKGLVRTHVIKLLTIYYIRTWNNHWETRDSSVQLLFTSKNNISHNSFYWWLGLTDVLVKWSVYIIPQINSQWHYNNKFASINFIIVTLLLFLYIARF